MVLIFSADTLGKRIWSWNNVQRKSC